MKWLTTGAMLLAAISTAAHAQPESSKPPDLQCNVGPVSKVVGGNGWLVYSCSRPDTLVFVAEGQNPASPFYFLLYRADDGGRRLTGEGTGAKAATEPAFREIESLTSQQVAGLIAETRASIAPKQRE